MAAPLAFVAWLARLVSRVLRLGRLERRRRGRERGALGDERPREPSFDLEGLPAPLRDAELHEVAGQLFAVAPRELTASLRLVHAFYVEIGAWHRDRPATRLAVYRAAVARVETRLVHGPEAVLVADRTITERSELDAAERRIALRLGRRLTAATESALASGTSATACRGACRIVDQILADA